MDLKTQTVLPESIGSAIRKLTAGRRILQERLVFRPHSWGITAGALPTTSLETWIIQLHGRTASRAFLYSCSFLLEHLAPKEKAKKSKNCEF